MKNTIFTISFLIILVLTGITGIYPATMVQADSPKVLEQEHEQAGRFSIEKMTCAMCPITVKKAMKKVDGVRSVSVNYDNKTANVIFDPTVTNAQKIADASTNIGYPATLIDGGLGEVK